MAFKRKSVDPAVILGCEPERVDEAWLRVMKTAIKSRIAGASRQIPDTIIEAVNYEGKYIERYTLKTGQVKWYVIEPL